MVLFCLPRTLLHLLPLSVVVVAAPTTPLNASAPSTFIGISTTAQPPATGDTAIPGSIVTIINTAGPGSVIDTFIYTEAMTTVPPTGNVTLSPTGAQATASNLDPNPVNLQTACAKRVEVGFTIEIGGGLTPLLAVLIWTATGVRMVGL